jgi:pentatricopeptide repeat protein
LDRNFAGCLVTAVLKDSAAWNQGVRPGDVLVATSATLGEGMWPKSNLVGVQSALSSRAAMADKFTLELQTPAVALVAAEKELDNRYELSIARPTGLQIQDSADGYVVVTAIAENAPVVVQYAVQVGDRVLAVDSALGDRLWPVSTTEGVISACTSRLPGQAVRMRFERPRANMVKSSTTTTPVVKSTTVSRQATSAANKMSTSGNAAAVLAKAPVNQRDLLKRCREVLRRYAEKGNEQTSVGARFMGKYAVPAIVADKVVDALASASVAIDSVTLSMIMSAYLSCRQPEDAIRIFEAAVGLPADGSTEAMTDAVINGKNGGKIVPSESALNLFTATAVLQAHALTGDIASVSRVLASLEGRSGVDVCGVKSAPWPWTGKYGSIQPDTQCYNIAIASAAKLGGEQGVDTALILLEQMNDASKTKDIVTYNTLISALTKLGRSDEAFALFEKMKRAGIRPDKFTYTSLIKLCSDDDVQELLFDMQERGVQADVVTYNSVIKSLCQDWKWTQATKLVNEMESRGISPDSMTYGLLMNGMLKAGKAGACLTLFESACASDRSVSLTENVHLYTTAITAAAVLGDHERALEFVSRMTAIGVKPNLKTLTAVMGACMSSGRFDLATQIYKRIDSPDGFAMSQGLRALCETGDVASAAAILYKLPRRTREMTGKQIMLSYKTAIEAALKENDFETARDVLSDLLKKGYIPNKAIFLSMTQSIQFESAEEEGATAAVERFTFLLFVIDSIQKRSLPVDASLYSSTLLLGNQNGGVTRRIASLLAKAKTTAQTGSKELLSSPDMDKEGLTQGWEHLQLHYDSSSESSTDSMLPPLSVRVSAREMRKVLSAEQAVTFAPRNKPRKQQRTAPPRPQQ